MLIKYQFVKHLNYAIDSIKMQSIIQFVNYANVAEIPKRYTIVENYYENYYTSNK